jgi:AcrR family transcriptional regulator
MTRTVQSQSGKPEPELALVAPAKRRRVRADALRNVDALLAGAVRAFKRSGVDAPAREVAAEAGVGVGTMYRHFPKRSDLVAAVFRSEVDACEAAAATLATDHAGEPLAALRAWLYRYMDFIVTKRGLASALHSGDDAFVDLHEYFDARLGPALASLIDDAVRAGEIAPALPAHTLLHAVRSLCVPDDDGSVDHTRPVIDLIIEGMQHRVEQL